MHLDIINLVLSMNNKCNNTSKCGINWDLEL